MPLPFLHSPTEIPIGLHATLQKCSHYTEFESDTEIRRRAVEKCRECGFHHCSCHVTRGSVKKVITIGFSERNPKQECIPVGCVLPAY